MRCIVVWTLFFPLSKNHLQCDNYCRFKGFKWIFLYDFLSSRIFFSQTNSYFNLFLFLYWPVTHKRLFRFPLKKNDLENAMVAIAAVATLSRFWNGKRFLPQDFFVEWKREKPRTASNSLNPHLLVAYKSCWALNECIGMENSIKSIRFVNFFSLFLFQFVFKCSIYQQTRKEGGRKEEIEKSWMASLTDLGKWSRRIMFLTTFNLFFFGILWPKSN